MADVPISLIPAEASPDSTDRVLCWNGTSTSLVTIQQINNIVKAIILGNPSAAFNTLEKLEDGKLNIDGTIGATGNLDLNGNTLVNMGPLVSNLPMGGNRIVGLGYPGILVRAPTLVTISDPTWDYDPLTQLAIVEGVGGGGAGGGSLSNADQSSAGTGGNAGAYFRSLINVAALTIKSANITIGAGGTGAVGAAGGAGGNTTYVDEINTLTAAGGAGGLVCNTTTIKWVNASTPAIATGGTMDNVHGAQGGSAMCTGTTLFSQLIIKTGRGGRSRFGEGGHEVGFASTTGVNAVGIAAYGYGAGGSGSYTILTSTAQAGGAGGAGRVMVWEFM